MENPVVLQACSEGVNGSKEKMRESEGKVRSKVDEYRKIADLSGFENLKSMIRAETFVRKKKISRKNKKRKMTESWTGEIADLTGFENLKAMVEVEASMRRKNRNRKKKKTETQVYAQGNITVNVAMQKEQLGKDETLNIVEKEGGNGSKEMRRRNERRKKSKLDEYQRLCDLSGFENLKAMIEAEASIRRKKRNRKKRKGNIELCAQEDVNDGTKERIGQLAEDEVLKMVEASKPESVWISAMSESQNLVIDAAKEDEGGRSAKTTKATWADDGLNSFEVIDICSSPSEDDESISDVSLGRKVLGTGKAVQTPKAAGADDGANSVEVEVIDVLSSLSEDEGSISCVSLGRSVEKIVKAVQITNARGADDWVNPVEVVDLFLSSSEDKKSISEVNVARNVEDTVPVGPVERGKKRRRWRRRNKKMIKAKDTIDDTREGNDVKDNIVFRMLLRKPRYFDPPDWNLTTCSYCGQESHTAASCKAQKRKKPCFLCGSLKHIWKYCRKGQDCFISKVTGQHANDCPETYQGSNYSFNICLRCGDSGHDMFSCGGDYPADDLKEIQCYVCKSFGRLCCVNSSNVVQKQVSCYNCGQSGHFGSECTKSCKAPGRMETSIICYKCGKEGHFARRCGGNLKDRLRISDLL